MSVLARRSKLLMWFDGVNISRYRCCLGSVMKSLTRMTRISVFFLTAESLPGSSTPT